MTFRTIIYQGDGAACFHWRCKRPFEELKRYGVEMYHTPVFPSAPDRPGPDFATLVEQISHFDLVIVARITSLSLMRFIVNAAFLNSTPVVYEVDDDYKNLIQTNPCYYGTSLDNELLDRARQAQLNGRMEELADIMPQLEASRVAGLKEYREALGLFDAITVTTPELRSVLLPHNKNIEIFANQMEFVHFWRDKSMEESDPNGRMVQKNLMGMRTVPSFYMERDPKTFEPILNRDGSVNVKRIFKVAYAGTVSHRADFGTIQNAWSALAAKWADRTHFVYLGDPWFYRQQGAFLGEKTEHNPEGDGRPNRRIHIPESDIPMYLLNLRAADLIIAPLEPVVFNQSKSDLKALEGASWGACPVLPDYVTYSRFWDQGKTAFLYKNEKEFFEIIDHLLTNPAVMEQVGRQARQYVHDFRLEKDHAERRYLFYKNLIESKRKPVVITPNRVTK